ncbi:radical SAM protein [Natroniella sulfidigena]|uniref:elongator complex protein 3 n=1 Tax=Natroniella sulfidigena TaxID=723921 RepID=UPI00200A502C|nr:radical SAM protein [Natroniella sulfidigena]MCK8816567.1 radical SAM protein [Natroniella sulfidigena]
MSKQDYIIPIFVPHLGCPHDCVFCNQEEITGIKTEIDLGQVSDQIDDYLTTIPAQASRIEVAFYGGSFTGIPQQLQQDLLAIANRRLVNGRITGIRLSTRPDYIDRKVLDFLQQNNVTAIELGVQTLDNEVLAAAGRGHTREDTLQAVELIKEYNFQLGLQIMPGLPSSNEESDLATGREVIKLQPGFVRVYPTLVIKNTELAQLYQTDNYTPLSLEEAVEITAKLLNLFKKANLDVIRIGLQPSESVNRSEILAGPFHPAFRQLVESKMFLTKVEKKLDESSVGDKVEMTVHPKDLSNLKGQKKKNFIYLKDKYEIDKIEVRLDDTLVRGEVLVELI